MAGLIIESGSRISGTHETTCAMAIDVDVFNAS